MFTESGRRSAALLRELAHQWETGAIDWREYRAARASLLAAQATSDRVADGRGSDGDAARVDAGSQLAPHLPLERIGDRDRRVETEEPQILSFEDYRRQRRLDRFETREGGRRRAA